MIQNKQPLSIIIPVFNEEKYIGQCLDAIKCQSVMPDEVIVVNNNSTDTTEKIARTFPFVRVIQERKQGMIFARNAGFNSAKGDLLARIDADTRVPDDWVKTIHLIFSVNESIYGVSGPQYFYAIHNRFIRRVVSDIFSRYGYFAITRLMLGHETLFGSNMIITKRAWDKVKHEVCLDADMHEDIDLAVHIGNYGRLVLDNRLLVGISSRALYEPFSKHVWRLRAWVQTITRHRPLFIGSRS